MKRLKFIAHRTLTSKEFEAKHNKLLHSKMN